MRLYYIRDEYIEFLSRYDSKVLYNKKETRPYIGVVLSVNNHDYYVPLAHPKPKHIKMSNSKDFHKIAGGKYGALNFNNMVPVIRSELIELDIEGIANEKYKNLLRNQFIALTAMKNVIIAKANNLYSMYTLGVELSVNDRKVIDRCCNYPVLEEKTALYQR